jgi:cysteine-rich repeat protein
VRTLTCGQGLSGCTLPFSTSQVGGPSLGRITFALDGDGLDIVNVAVEVFAGWDVYGRVGLAPNGRDSFRGVAGWTRFELDAVPGTLPSPNPASVFPTRDWSLGIGAYAHPMGIGHRLTMPLAVECGNGVVELGEQCDDGNLVDGDGCDSTCVIEEPDDDDDHDDGVSVEETDRAGPHPDPGAWVTSRAQRRRVIFAVPRRCHCASARRQRKV